MNICCIEAIVPSVKLAKMLNFFKVIGFIHFAIIILDLFLFQTNIFLLFAMQLVIMLFCICRKEFGCFLILILILLMYIYRFIEGAISNFLSGIKDGSRDLDFGFRVFLCIFEIFCIFYTFQMYKQAKHEYRIQLGIIPDDRVQIQDNENAMAGLNNGYNEEGNNQNNNQDEFQPFQGNGVVVGGGDNNQ